MKKIILAITLIQIVMLPITSCKKGEKDPLISMRTRKARLVGKWNCSLLSAKYSESGSGGNYSIDLNYNGSSLSYSDGYSSYSSSYLLDMQFDKDGKFSGDENWDGNYVHFSGTWNFMGRVGDDKNKESIVVKISSSSDGVDNTLIAVEGNTLTFRLKELKNKEMILVKDDNPYTDATTTDKFVGDFTFKQ